MSEENAEKALQEAVVNNYIANLNFLKEYDNDLYNRVEGLTQFIASGDYPERFRLEFIKENGDFDIYDIKNDTYLYNKKPKKFNDKAVSSVNFDKKGSFSTIDPVLFNGDIIENTISVNELQDKKDAIPLLAKETYEYYSILKDKLNTKKSFKRIEKFVFIGTLLGRHINRIANKIKAKNYFVTESNLEIFRLSLFVNDYTHLAVNGSNVRFSIMDDAEVLHDKMTQFLMDNRYENHTIKYYTTDYNVSEDFNNILNAVTGFKPTIFNHNMYLHNLLRNMTQRVNQYRVLNFSKTEKIIDYFKDKPVIFAGAGPSLDDNMDWIKENQEKFIIVSMGASFNKLLNNGIKSDIIFTIDSDYTDLDNRQFSLENTKKIEDALVVASVNTDQRILDRFNQDKLFLIETVANLLENNLKIDGFSVGEITFRVLLELGFSNIYLIGTDLALNQETGSSHSLGKGSEKHQFDLSSGNANKSLEDGVFNFKGDLIEIDGNLRKKVWTSRHLILSLNFYNFYLNQFKKEYQKIFNLCTHGALINGAFPTTVESIDLKEFLSFDKSKLKDEIVEKLSDLSAIKLNEEENKKVKKELSQVEDYEKLIDSLFNKKLESFEQFNENCLVFHNKLFETINYDILLQTFVSFEDVFNVYISYHFNDTKLKKEMQKLEKIQKLHMEKILELLGFYKKYLKSI